MSIARVVRWKTSDGKEHGSEREAKAQEALLKAEKQLQELLAISIKTGRPESILRELLLESRPVSDILIAYRRYQPKPPNAEDLNAVLNAAPRSYAA